MRLNITSKILESVQELNDDTKSLSYKALREEATVKGLRTCPRCGNRIIGYPAVSRYDNKTEICSDCGTEEALENMMGYITNPNTGEKVSLEDLKAVRALENNESEDLAEEVTIDTPTQEDLEADDENIKAMSKKDIEDKIGKLRAAVQDGMSEDEREATEKDIAELEDALKESADLASNSLYVKIVNELDNNIYGMEKEEAIELLKQIKKDCDVFISSLK